MKKNSVLQDPGSALLVDFLPAPATSSVVATVSIKLSLKMKLNDYFYFFYPYFQVPPGSDANVQENVVLIDNQAFTLSSLPPT